MGWSAGTFTRTNGVYSGTAVWTSDAAASVKITAARHDAHDQDLSAGINACLHKGGQNSPTADMAWGGYKITGLGNGVAASDAAAYGQTITGFSWDSGLARITATRAAGNLTVDLSGLGGSATWGGITGTLSSQTDLQTVLDALKTLPKTDVSSGTTLGLIHQAGLIRMTSAGDTVTIPLNSSVAFPIGSTVTVFNDHSASNEVQATGGVTLRKAWVGTTGTVTLAAYGLCSLIKVGTDSWVISGAGVS